MSWVELLARGLAEWALWKTSEESRWLPHHTVPMDALVAEGDAGLDAAASRMDAYYRTHGVEIARAIESAAACHEVDDEAKATLREAVRAHEQGLYRSSCRVLLPEIERVIREDWLGVTGVRVLGTMALKTTAGRLELGDLAQEVGDLALFVRINSAFARFDSPESGNRLAPNRHAVAHAWEVYDSAQDSLNTIICTDYVYRTAMALKERARRLAAGEERPRRRARDSSPRPASGVGTFTIPEMPDFGPSAP